MNKENLPLEFQPYADFAEGFVIAVVIFIIGWIASKWASSLVSKSLAKRKVDEALSRFLGAIAQYSVLAATVITALQSAGVATTSFVALLGSAGLAIGLALQGSLANFASGVMILFFRPFRLEEIVCVSGQTGRIVDIGIFATTLFALNGEKVIVANSAVMSGTIINYSDRGARRGNIEIGVAYGSDIPTVLEVLEKAATDSPYVLKDPAAAVAFVSFGASSLDFLVLPHANPDQYLDMLHDVKVRIYDGLNKAGIEIPFSQLVIHNNT